MSYQVLSNQRFTKTTLAVCLAAMLASGTAAQADETSGQGPILSSLIKLIAAPAATPGESPSQRASSAAAAKSETAALSQFAREYRQALFLVGCEGDGFGTAFVINKEHRLLATNAHVADIASRTGKMYAMMNGTTAIYKVVNIWYHPGVMRMIGNTSLQIAKSNDPRDGAVYVMSPDVAILQLSDDGADLPVEFTLARPSQVDDLFAREVGMIGYPGHTAVVPHAGESPNAVFHTGVISHQTNYAMGNSEMHQKRQLLRHTITGGNGFSGAPLFDSQGRVVGLHNSGRGRQEATPLGTAIRVDAIWETLATNKLLSMFDPAKDVAEFDVAKLTTPDPRTAVYRKIRNDITAAQQLNNAGKYADASKKCNGLIRDYPNSPFAYLERSISFLNYVADQQNNLSLSDIREKQMQALQDVQQYRQQVPANDRGVVTHLKVLYNLVLLDQREGKIEDAQTNARALIPFATKAIQSNLSSYIVAEGYSIRALTKQVLNDLEGGLADYNKAVELFPNSPMVYTYRAKFHETVTGKTDLAQADYQRAQQLANQQRVG